MFKHDDMQALIAGVDEKFTGAGTNNPAFAGKKALLLQGTLGREGAQVMTPGWRSDFLTQMGFTVADDVDAGRRPTADLGHRERRGTGRAAR